MNGCPDKETIAAWVDRRLDAPERDRIDGHLAACATCRADAVALTGLAKAAVSPALRRRILAVARPSRRWMWAVASGVAAAAVVAIGLATFKTEPPPQDPPVVTVPPKVVPAHKPPAPKPEPPPPPKPEPPKVEPPPAPKPEVPRPVPKVEEPKPVPPPTPEPPKPVEPKPEPKPAPRVEPTKTVIAKVERPGAAAAEILEGQGVVTAVNGTAVVRYPDGTEIAVGPETKIARFSEDGGKRIELTQGVIRAQVTKQPAGRAFVVATPHGDARVVGTTFRLTVRAALARLEVEEGKVQLKGKDVAAGQVAVLAAGAETVAKPITSLLGHWKLDETDGRVAVDATGLGNDGALKDKTEWAPSRIAGGVACKKAGFYVPEFHAPGAPLGNAYTVSMWIWHDTLDTWQDVYFSMPGLAIVREGNLDLGRIRVSFKTDPPADNLALDAIMRAKQWIHLTLTWDGAQARLYRNGKSVGAAKVKGTMEPPKSMSINVGAEVEGKIDDVRLYRRALSGPEVLQVMNGGDVK